MIPQTCQRVSVIAICLGAFVSATFIGLAQAPVQIFDRANQLYQQNKFVEAKDAYESILHNGFVNGELYYNLGNAYYKLGDLGRAVLNYERASRLMPNDDDLKHNLQLANLMITDKIEPTPRLFIWDYWDSIKMAFSVNTLTWASYIVLVFLIASLCTVILSHTYRVRRMGLFVGSVSTVVLVFCIVLFVGKINEVERKDTAVVIAKITTVKNSPDDKSSDAFVLHCGVKVHITDSVNDWMKVRLADGKVGWMEKDAAEVI